MAQNAKLHPQIAPDCVAAMVMYSNHPYPDFKHVFQVNIGSTVQVTEDGELLMSGAMQLIFIFDGLMFFPRVIGGMNDIDERLDSESEDI
jgi:hypothetical protein